MSPKQATEMKRQECEEEMMRETELEIDEKLKTVTIRKRLRGNSPPPTKKSSSRRH